MHLGSLHCFLFNGGLTFFLFISTLVTATPHNQYGKSKNSLPGIGQGQHPNQGLQLRNPQNPPPGAPCIDYHCAAEKEVRTTVGGNCNVVCQTNCAVMVASGDTSYVEFCVLAGKPFISPLGSFVLSSRVDPACTCKYCTCKCPYDIDNIFRQGINSCSAGVLCRSITGPNSGWRVTSAFALTPYPCHL
ncbi:hypothetical protein C8034_v006539 [Colletotrichum sidae]|uniref:Uncharacterized protein n=1 Tax=Colletotrichum sidae TaxID=1347389 RepID=A0A4V3I353_9PEZI|nr:hypothetical protein C8034_v006539 [Colletotrichum sidae]